MIIMMIKMIIEMLIAFRIAMMMMMIGHVYDIEYHLHASPCFRTNCRS